MKNRKLNRLPDFDYSRERSYFITFNTQNRVKYFGEISKQEMILNATGQIVFEQWQWLLNQYPYLSADSFVIMPEHFHAIMSIKTSFNKKKDEGVNHPKIKSISELVGAFKTTSSKRIRLETNPNFSWQRSFHDKIIQTPLEYENIKRYIQNNPASYGDHHG